MPNNDIVLPKNTELAKQILVNQSEVTNKKIDQGVLGSIWGGTASIPNNIAALSIIILIFTGIIYTFCAYDKPVNQIGISIKDFWAILTPLITLAIGYLFGDNKKEISK